MNIVSEPQKERISPLYGKKEEISLYTEDFPDPSMVRGPTSYRSFPSAFQHSFSHLIKKNKVICMQKNKKKR